MVTRRQTSALAQLYDAAKAPVHWPAALQSVAESVGGIGVGQVVLSKETRAVEWVTITGPCAELEPKYVSHYAPHDLYLPVLNATAVGRWMSLSHSLAESDMRGNAWYNDFILKTGIADIPAAKMYEDEETVVLSASSAVGLRTRRRRNSMRACACCCSRSPARRGSMSRSGAWAAHSLPPTRRCNICRSASC